MLEIVTKAAEIEYPESDGKPIAEEEAEARRLTEEQTEAAGAEITRLRALLEKQELKQSS